MKKLKKEFNLLKKEEPLYILFLSLSIIFVILDCIINNIFTNVFSVIFIYFYVYFAGRRSVIKVKK